MKIIKFLFIVIILGTGCKSNSTTSSTEDFEVEKAYWSDKYTLDKRPINYNRSKLVHFHQNPDSILNQIVEVTVYSNFGVRGAAALDIFKYPELRILVFDNEEGSKFDFPEDFPYERLTNVRDVLLSGRVPHHILEGVLRLPNLKRLCLDYIPSRRIPESIVDCKNLEYLEIVGDTKLPNNFEKMQQLKTLYYSNAPQENFNKIWSLNNLETLKIRALSVDSIPNEIINLKKLKVLCMYECRYLTYLSEKLGELENLERIEFGWLEMLEFPTGDILKNSTKLKRVVCGRTNIKFYPTLFNNTNLERLFLEYPAKLDSITNGVGKMKHLKRLYVNNELLYVSDSICNVVSNLNVNIGISYDESKFKNVFNCLKNVRRN